MTTRISALSSPRATASMMACKFVPSPDISTPSFTGGRLLGDARVDSLVISLRGSRYRHAARAAGYLTDDERALLPQSQIFHDRVRLAGRNNRNHAEAIVEGAIHLTLFDFAETRDQIEDRRNGPGAAPNRRVQILRHHTRQILDHPAAGDVGEPLDCEAIEQLQRG